MLAAKTGFRGCVAGVARGWGGEVLGEVVFVEVEEVVVVVDVAESGRGPLVEEVEGVDGEDAEAEQMDVGDVGAGFGTGAAIPVLWARRERVRVWASCVRAHFLCRPVCVRVLVLLVV